MMSSVGVGLRFPHLSEVLSLKPKIDFFEVHSENFFNERALQPLEKIREDYAIHLHGVGLSIASTDPLNFEYLKQLKNLINRIQPRLVSDHLCWSSFQGEYFHDLLPFPYDEDSLDHVVDRIAIVQDFLQRRLILENVTHYITVPLATMTEERFFIELTQRTGCGILLDVSNLFVSAAHIHLSPLQYIKTLPSAYIEEIHLAGHSVQKQNQEDIILDTHNQAVAPSVWQLYGEALKIIGPKPTLIEWDSQLPAFVDLCGEAAKAAAIMSHE